MKPIIRLEFLKSPKRKRIGWSEYTELRVHYHIIDNRTWVQKAVIRGKKFCLFAKFIWDYEIELIDYKTIQWKH